MASGGTVTLKVEIEPIIVPTKITTDDDFGDKICFRFAKRSYEDVGRELIIYVTGMDEVSVTAKAGSSHINWFMSADDMLVLKEWLDAHLRPAKASFTSTYGRRTGKGKPASVKIT